MKITISILPIMAIVLASTRASPFSVNSTSTTIILSEATSTTDTHYLHAAVIESPGWNVTIPKHKDPKKPKDKDKEKKKKECQVDACQTCVHACGDLRGFACIYFKCMPKLCTNCNLRIVHPTTTAHTTPPHTTTPHATTAHTTTTHTTPSPTSTKK